MKKIDRLKSEASESTAWREHNMTRFKTLSPTVAESVCVDCKMAVHVNTKPAPNGIDIGGEAVALNCTG